MLRRLASVEQPSGRSASRWFGTISRVRLNQNPDRPVSTRPLSGIALGSTTSNVEMRSVATKSRRSASSSKISRTLPLPTCTAVESDMNWFLLSGRQRGQALEERVDVPEGLSQVEDLAERLRAEPARNLPVCLHERAKVELLLPRAEGVPLHEAIGLVAGEARADEREEEALAEDETVRGLKVSAHPIRIDDEAFRQPGEAIEHVIECEKGVGNRDPLGARVRDVALVPEGDVL